MAQVQLAGEGNVKHPVPSNQRQPLRSRQRSELLVGARLIKTFPLKTSSVQSSAWPRPKSQTLGQRRSANLHPSIKDQRNESNGLNQEIRELSTANNPIRSVLLKTKPAGPCKHGNKGMVPLRRHVIGGILTRSGSTSKVEISALGVIWPWSNPLPSITRTVLLNPWRIFFRWGYWDSCGLLNPSIQSRKHPLRPLLSPTFAVQFFTIYAMLPSRSGCRGGYWNSRIASTVLAWNS